MENTYKNALLGLEELENQKKIEKISVYNINIENNINMSNIIISSFNSIYNKLKFRNSDKVNINKQFNDNTNNSDSNSDSNNANLNNIITINKKLEMN